MIKARIIKAGILIVLFLAIVECDANVSAPQQQAKDIIKETGIQGGLIIHVGCGDGKLTAALRVNYRYLVQGLDSDAENVIKARQYLKSIGQYGNVMIDHLLSNSLPYVDNSINLLVGEDCMSRR